MHAYYPLLLTGGIIGFISLILIVAYASIKDKKQAIGFDRHMKDGEIIRRLLGYAKPYRGKFLFVGCIMLVGIAYDILSPTIIGKVTDLIKDDFELPELYRLVAAYAGILIVSMVCVYVQQIWTFLTTKSSNNSFLPHAHPLSPLRPTLYILGILILFL